MPVDYVFEVSSEAGRRAGPVYPVLRGKAPLLAKKLGDRYALLGFYDRAAEAGEFQPEAPPAGWAKAFNELRPLGIDCYHGRWLRGGRARIVYLDAKRYGEQPAEYETEEGPKRGTQVGAIKQALWKSHGVDSLMMGFDFNEYLAWSHACGLLLEKLLVLDGFKDKRAVAQFHDWSAGAALLYAKSGGLPLATVYTPHSTVLGHALASSGRDVLAEAKRAGERRVDLHEAYSLKVEGKHLLEVACAGEADVFAAASGTVADESAYLLGKSPDLVAMDGLAPEEFRPPAEAGVAKYVRAELEEFLESYFAPYYDFRFEDALLVFLVGRYEFRPKGFDLYLKALGRLNDALKLEPKKERKVVAFLFTPSNVKGPKAGVLHNYLLMDKIHEFVREAEGDGVARLPLGEMVKRCSPVTASKLRAMVAGFRREGELPPVTCFDLNYSNDAVENACRSLGLDNSPDDVVKLLYYPTYLRPGDGLFDLEYGDVLAGMDVGVFPSRYEPFGHTPMESAASRNVTLASDATGFGRFLQIQQKSLAGRGVRVVPLVARSDEEVANALASELRELCLASPRKLHALKEDAYKLVRLLEWRAVLPEHLKAYELALARRPRESLRVSGRSPKKN